MCKYCRGEFGYDHLQHLLQCPVLTLCLQRVFCDFSVPFFFVSIEAFGLRPVCKSGIISLWCLCDVYLSSKDDVDVSHDVSHVPVLSHIDVQCSQDHRILQKHSMSS